MELICFWCLLHEFQCFVYNSCVNIIGFGRQLREHRCLLRENARSCVLFISNERRLSWKYCVSKIKLVFTCKTNEDDPGKYGLYVLLRVKRTKMVMKLSLLTNYTCFYV